MVYRILLFSLIFGKMTCHDSQNIANIWFGKVVFALCATLLVQEYALFAKHSGIPEIKTVLGGFVIRRFMGTWTLAIKSLGLVSERH